MQKLTMDQAATSTQTLLRVQIKHLRNHYQKGMKENLPIVFLRTTTTPIRFHQRQESKADLVLRRNRAGSQGKHPVLQD